MKIFNIRQGFATNSSSSHSILVIPDGVSAVTDTTTDFNWNYFTASNMESKQNYFASLINSNLHNIGWNKSQIKNFLLDFLPGIDFHKVEKKVSIDHQSVITFPRNWDNSGLNVDFLKDFKNYILKSNVVIVGGNDNDDQVHPLTTKSSKSIATEIPTETDSSHFVARNDDSHWVLFNRINGSKLRLSFNDIDSPKKAKTPELVDIKITDFCPYDCSFCYQDSTLKGQHAKLDDIKKIINELKEKQVMEIAYGGGETTLHPEFIEILKLSRDSKIIPNFTTKNFNLLKQSNAKQIVALCGGMAFSVSSLEDIEKVHLSLIEFKEKDKIKGEFSFNNGKVNNEKPWNTTINFQVVLGTMPEKEFKKILNKIAGMYFRVTLLGYKKNGRGNQFAPFDYSNWFKIVEEVSNKTSLRVSIDTALAAEYESYLKEKNIDERTFHVTEGNFSAYIDAVKMEIAPSSYVGLEQSKKFDENWLNNWKKMSATPTFKKTIKIMS